MPAQVSKTLKLLRQNKIIYQSTENFSNINQHFTSADSCIIDSTLKFLERSFQFDNKINMCIMRIVLVFAMDLHRS